MRSFNLWGKKHRHLDGDAGAAGRAGALARLLDGDAGGDRDGQGRATGVAGGVIVMKRAT